MRAQDLLPDIHNHAGLLRDVTALPRPAWDAVPWQRYGFLTVFTSRGCDDACKYCAYVTVQGRLYRPRPISEVVDEMVWLQETFRPRRIMARDPVFASDRARTIDMMRRLHARGFITPWECESRPEHFDPALLKEMAAAGCNVIKIGVESADPEHLTALGRIEHPHEAAPYLAYTRRVVAAAQRNGIAVRAFVMVGLPDQTQAQAETTAVYLRQLAPTYIHVRPYIPYPRVPLGDAPPAADLASLIAPLQTVADERAAAGQSSSRSRSAPAPETST